MLRLSRSQLELFEVIGSVSPKVGELALPSTPRTIFPSHPLLVAFVDQRAEDFVV